MSAFDKTPEEVAAEKEEGRKSIVRKLDVLQSLVMKGDWKRAQYMLNEYLPGEFLAMAVNETILDAYISNKTEETNAE